jgi:uncharacterized membrane protein YkvA (DUF1232 family)
MPSTSPSLPDALQKYLSTNTSADVPSLARYVDEGAALVTPEAIATLRGMHASLLAKIAGVVDSAVLRQRLELLMGYFEATSETSTNTTTLREVAFALLYFLKGLDRIPDSVPEVGLLDDAMVVQSVLQRHETVLEVYAKRLSRGPAVEG